MVRVELANVEACAVRGRNATAIVCRTGPSSSDKAAKVEVHVDDDKLPVKHHFYYK